MRKFIPIMVLACLPACAVASAPPLGQWQGDAAHAVTAQALVAEEKAAWRDIWTRIGQAEPEALPDGMVAIAVFAGQKRSGGYGVEFLETRQEDTQTVIPYRIRKPRFDEMVTQALTAPYAVKLLPRGDKPIRLEEVR